MYATDLGTRRVALPRTPAALCADAEAALAFGLETDDLDLTAELCMTWPMLGRRWSPAAAFAFGILAREEDDRGFLPGIGFDPGRYDGLPAAERRDEVLATSYHATYVMGFLCAIALTNGVIPPAAVRPGHRSRGAGRILLDRIDTTNAQRAWLDAARALAPTGQDAIAPLILAATLRRARERGDMGLLRDALGVAVDHDLVRGPGTVQAAALLRRAVTLDAIRSRRPDVVRGDDPSTDLLLKADRPVARPHRAVPAAHP
jgi:GNAT superfamily N-acetyltransferase